MAQLAMPSGINFGSSTQPNSIMVLIANNALMHGGSPSILTRPVLGMPDFSQLINPTGGYAL